MKRTSKILALLLVICTCLGSVDAQANEFDWKVNEIKDFFVEDEAEERQLMNAMKNGSVHYVANTESHLKSKKDGFYTLFTRKTIGNTKIKKTEQFKGNFAKNYKNYFYTCDIIKAFEKSTIAINYKTKKDVATLFIEEYNRKGKQILKITDKINLNKNHYGIAIDDIMVKGEKIYYCYREANRPNKLYIRCINKKENKIKSKKISTITIPNNYSGDYMIALNKTRLAEGYMYVMQANTINKYSLKGKHLEQYLLPEGETEVLSPNPSYTPMNTDESKYLSTTIKHFCVRNGKVFYCNRDGIYRLSNTKNSTLIYASEGDQFFGSDYGVADICAGDENTFYIMFNHISNYTPCVFNWAYRLAKYTK
ncbi:MAG: hypothetical protein E7267_02200 [Lachnospiraceae bacterium]|nr:hypothetical protein [Lachnospiraceae bacterium]